MVFWKQRNWGTESIKIAWGHTAKPGCRARGMSIWTQVCQAPKPRISPGHLAASAGSLSVVLGGQSCQEGSWWRKLFFKITVPSIVYNFPYTQLSWESTYLYTKESLYPFSGADKTSHKCYFILVHLRIVWGKHRIFLVAKDKAQNSHISAARLTPCGQVSLPRPSLNHLPQVGGSPAFSDFLRKAPKRIEQQRKNQPPGWGAAGRVYLLSTEGKYYCK